ncbi:Flocculation protein [Quillaja saponaria]|uniref:Flocculation protein n=1 Tax=Quillaja saponaria TaxID=32244 RepID=A0AAD7M1Z5_QUISA|nr:Flocculation protein [Quillaja saponaria]
MVKLHSFDTKHFEPVEVGMLAESFFIPLVLIRVGKIDKQGSHPPLLLIGNSGINVFSLPASLHAISCTSGTNENDEQYMQTKCLGIDNSKEGDLQPAKLLDLQGRDYHWKGEKYASINKIPHSYQLHIQETDYTMYL